MTLQRFRTSTLKTVKGISGTKGRKSPGRRNGEPGSEWIWGHDGKEFWGAGVGEKPGSGRQAESLFFLLPYLGWPLTELRGRKWQESLQRGKDSGSSREGGSYALTGPCPSPWKPCSGHSFHSYPWYVAVGTAVRFMYFHSIPCPLFTAYSPLEGEIREDKPPSFMCTCSWEYWTRSWMTKFLKKIYVNPEWVPTKKCLEPKSFLRTIYSFLIIESI